MISQVLPLGTTNISQCSEQFRLEFNATLLSYQNDFGVMDEEFERMELDL